MSKEANKLTQAYGTILDAPLKIKKIKGESLKVKEQCGNSDDFFLNEQEGHKFQKTDDGNKTALDEARKCSTEKTVSHGNTGTHETPVSCGDTVSQGDTGTCQDIGICCDTGIPENIGICTAGA